MRSARAGARDAIAFSFWFEDVWLWAAGILAALLAINSMLVLWTLQIARQIGMLMTLGLAMWLLLYYVFVFYLLGQWLVD